MRPENGVGGGIWAIAVIAVFPVLEVELCGRRGTRGRRVLLVRRGKADSIPATLSVSYP